MQKRSVSRGGLRGLVCRALLLTVLMVGTGVLAQPQEEPLPEGVFKLAEIRIFLSSPVRFAWKLPMSKFLLAYVQGPEKPGETPSRRLVVLDGKGRLDGKRTEALKAAIAQADPTGMCMDAGEGMMPLLMPLGAKGLALQPSHAPERSCLFTWNARRSAIELQGADSARDFCGAQGCPPQQCWWTESCWLPEGPDLDTARKGFALSPLAQSLVETLSAPGEALLAATLPGSGRVLLWVPSGRLADPEDPAKKMDSRVLVYDPRKRAIDAALTRQLAKALDAPMDECQGLGTLTELQRGEKGVTLRQSYDHGTTHLRCSSTVTWNLKGRRFDVEAQPSTE